MSVIRQILTSRTLIRLLGKPLPQTDNIIINGISTDSRTCKKGDLFIAVKGEKFNGYNFCTKALRQKAAALVVNKYDYQHKPLTPDPDTPVFTVDDTVKAYGSLAAFYLQHFSGVKIAVTGSSGKTTTREMLKTMLSLQYSVFANARNYNNHIGIPKSIFTIEKNYDYYIFELGMNHKNEIDFLSRIIKPDISVITNISAAHIKYFKNTAAIADAKSEIFNGQPAESCAYLNAGDKYLSRLEQRAQSKLLKIKKFNLTGLKYTADRNYVLYNNRRYTVNFSGGFNLLNTECALSIAADQGISRHAALQSLSAFRGIKSRFQVYHGKPMLIDDAYNANPDSMIRAVKAAVKLADGKPLVLVLGDMLELGTKSPALHRQLGDELEKLTAALVQPAEIIFTGDAMAAALKRIKTVPSKKITNNVKIRDYILKNLNHDAVYFFKASNRMRLFDLVKELLCYTI
ncbi:MAG TPA: UDP-N-acetylmuramoyl-tripeptide--D-alanyl-D-alanine ligase [Spirochaetota bacterium]|nr:UDP-N-acetylmuramoyl-tripeptide--D-alanyl-D-alanine ligase [Spirochaetota bacterium]